MASPTAFDAAQRDIKICECTCLFSFLSRRSRRTLSSLQIIFVSRSFVRPGTSFDLTRSQSGWTKHVFPSPVYANVVRANFRLSNFYIGSQMPCHSVRPGLRFCCQNLNFSGQLSDDRLLFAALCSQHFLS